MNIETILNKFENFDITSGYRMLIDRSKSGKDKNKQK